MTQPLKRRLIEEVIRREGGFIDHPADKGGPTKYGITEATARRHGYEGDMQDMPYAVAFEIYATEYWHALELDQIVTISEPLAENLFDYGIHSGPGQAAEDLQGLLNLLNRAERDYDDIATDGVIGPNTLATLNAFRRVRGGEGVQTLTEAVKAIRIAFLLDLADAQESQEAFTFGWISRVVELGRSG